MGLWANEQELMSWWAEAYELWAGAYELWAGAYELWAGAYDWTWAVYRVALQLKNQSVSCMSFSEPPPETDISVFLWQTWVNPLTWLPISKCIHTVTVQTHMHFDPESVSFRFIILKLCRSFVIRFIFLFFILLVVNHWKSQKEIDPDLCSIYAPPNPCV